MVEKVRRVGREVWQRGLGRSRQEGGDRDLGVGEKPKRTGSYRCGPPAGARANENRGSVRDERTTYVPSRLQTASLGVEIYTHKIGVVNHFKSILAFSLCLCTIFRSLMFTLNNLFRINKSTIIVGYYNLRPLSMPHFGVIS